MIADIAHAEVPDCVFFTRRFTDKVSGRDRNRPGLDRMIEFVREGDTLFCHSMDRLARNLDDLRLLVKTLTAKGVKVCFVKETLTFTGEDSPMANLLLSVMGAIAEFEREVDQGTPAGRDCPSQESWRISRPQANPACSAGGCSATTGFSRRVEDKAGEGAGRVEEYDLIVPRPRGADWLEDELFAMKREGIDVLISLLAPEEQKELGLDAEPAACEQAGIQYMNFTIADRQVPASQKAFAAFLEQVKHAADSGKSVGAHCRAGIGRSSLMIAALLCSQGLSSQEAFQRLSSARGLSVPDTPEQVEWVAVLWSVVHLERTVQS